MYDAARIVGEQVRTVADMDQPNLNKHNTDIIRFGLGRLSWKKGAFEERRSSGGGDMSASTILARLKRTHYDISPEEYRDKWGLPSDYPMVAPAYAAARSHLVKSNAAWQGGSRSDRATTFGAG